MCWFCVFVCVILCMCLHSRKLVYSGEVSELVKVPTVLSSFLNQKQLFHKAVYLMKFDCPLLTMVDFFCVIPSSSVCAAVSVVHKCTTTCSFVEKTASAVVEGCDTSVNRLVFVHDWTNTVYCNNIYCLKNNN